MASEITPPLTEAEEQALRYLHATLQSHKPLSFVVKDAWNAAVAAIRAAERERVLREVEAMVVVFAENSERWIGTPEDFLLALRGGDRDA